MNRSELKQALLRGGLYLTIRQVLSLTLSLASVLVITRMLGPEHYGWVTIALYSIPFVTNLADMGLKVYLIRKPEDCPVQLQGEVLVFLIGSGGVLSLATAIASPLIAHWVNVPELALILTAMAPAVLLDACTGVPMGLLERNLQYQRSSSAEIGAQLIYYTAAIPLVWLGWDVWAIVTAYLLRSLFQAVMAFVFYPVRPVWPKRLKALRAALGYGLSYSTSRWVIETRVIAVQLLVGKFVGVEAVGLVGATNRIADSLAFVRVITSQLGISGFAKLQEDPLAMRRALNRGMIYQNFLMTVPLGLFACLSPVLIPLVLGIKWIGVVGLFPFVGLASLVKGIFELHMLVLHSMGHNLEVFRFHVVNLFVICSTVALLCEPFGIWGYAAAEMIALIVYALLYQSVSRIIGSPNYTPIFWLLGCTLIPCFMGPYLSPLIGVPMLVVGFLIACLASAELRVAGSELVAILIQRIRIT
jgi:PST family polysaccharide transporter